MRRIWSLICLAGVLPTAVARAQTAGTDAAPIVDTVVVVTRNVFDRDEAGDNLLFRLANGLHVTTRAAIVRQELLFAAGEPLDSARLAETERNLRALRLFRDVQIDTVRTGRRLAVRVETADGWSTQLQLNARSTADTLSWSAGLLERNFLGVNARVGVFYRDEPNRTALTLRAGMHRLLGTRLLLEGLYEDLSDGSRGQWLFGAPFRALADRAGIVIGGEAARERVLQFRDGSVADSLWHRQVLATGEAAVAPRAGTGGYLRVGVRAQLKREEYVALEDTALAVPDSVTAAVGVFGELARARFRVLTHYASFERETDVDLSSRLTVAAWLAPAGLGYPRTGIGPSVAAQTGAAFGAQFVQLRIWANGLFTAGGLDSGQVGGALTVASQALPRSATVLYLEAAARRGTPPGAEFALGHGQGPRAFGPNAFTGDRSVWGALEHRAFLVDEVLGLLGVGLAAFVDYGGAWFADQSPRLGGDVGVGLRLGATRASGPNIGRLDLAYRFGDGAARGWVVSFGRGFAF